MEKQIAALVGHVGWNVIIADFARLHINHQWLHIRHRPIGVIPQVGQIHAASRGIGRGKRERMFLEGGIVR